MALTWGEILRCVRNVIGGAAIGGGLGYLSYLPSLFVEGSDAYATSGQSIALGVTLVCARAGAVVGLIYFLIKRQLTHPTPPPAS